MLFCIPIAHRNPEISLPNRSDEQVIALFLIIRRVADRRALTKESVPSWNIGSIHFKSQGDSSTVGDEVPPNGDPMCSMDAHREAFGESGIEAETTTIEEIPS